MKHIIAALMGLIIMSPVVSFAWQENGVVICDDLSLQSNPVIASDDVYGAIITWVDHRGGSYDIYAQRVDSSGVRLWTPENGIVICDTAGTQRSCKIVSDGSSGATYPELLTEKDNLLQCNNWFFDIARIQGRHSNPGLVEVIVRAINDFGAKRMLFGSNAPFQYIKSSLLKVQHASIKERDKDMILLGNALHIISKRKN